MSITDPVPPVPQHTPPIEEVGTFRRFTTNWMQWFLQLRDKVNVINESLISLGLVTDPGILAKQNDGSWAVRTVTGTANRVSVANGDGSDNPVIDIEDEGIEDIVAGFLVAGDNITLTHDDGAGTLTIASSGGGGGGGGASDPLYDDDVLLLNMPGADDSVVFVDDSPIPFTVNTNGNAHIETSLGYNTGFFDGVNSYLNIGSNVPSRLQLGSGNFTIDFWVYTLGTSTYAICGNLDDGTGNGHYWVILNSTFTGLHTVQFGIQGTTYKFGTTALSANTLHHIELDRDGTDLYCFVDGQQIGTTQTLNNFTGTTSLPFRVGSTSGGGNANYLNGHLRVLRITKNVRHTADFTPSLPPYPTTSQSSGASAGYQIGYAYTETSTPVSGSTAIPLDNTIPQITEGNAWAALDTTITPSEATSLLEVEVTIPCVSNQDGNSTPSFAIFRDGATDAIFAGLFDTPTAGGFVLNSSIRFVVAAGSTSATTFSFRYGNGGGNTVYMLQSLTNQFYGGVMKATMTIKEIKQ